MLRPSVCRLVLVTGLLILQCSPLRAVEAPSLDELLQQRLIEHSAIVEQDAENIASLQVLAFTYERLGNWSRALDYYRQIRALDANHGPAQRGCARLEKILAPKVQVRRAHYVDEEFLPEIHALDYRREEAVTQVLVAKQFGKATSLQLGWLNGTIDQQNEVYQDTDFSLRYSGPSFNLSLPLSSRISLLSQGQYSRYRTDGTDGFYPLLENKDLLTGTTVLNYRSDRFWLAAGVTRYRDFNLNYQSFASADVPPVVTYRSDLQIVAQTLYALEAGTSLSEKYKLSGGLLYENSRTLDPDQFQLKGRLDYQPDDAMNLHLYLQGDYYFEEEKTVAGGGVKYLFTLFKNIDTTLGWRLTYTDTDDAWLNWGTLDLKQRLTPRFALLVRGDLGRETGGDEDRFYNLNGALEVRF